MSAFPQVPHPTAGERRRPPSKAAMVILTGLAVAALVTVGARSSATASTVATPGVTKTLIKLGATSIRTGPVASACGPVQTGAASWISYVNKHGGVYGRKINWKVVDDGNEAGRAVNNARQLVESDNVFALFGGCGSVGGTASLPEVDSHGVPYLFPDALALPILKPPHATTYSFIPLYHQQLAAILTWMFSKFGVGNVALVAIPGLDANMVPTVEAVTNAAGAKVVAELSAPTTTTDWGPTVLRLQQANAKYVLFGTSTAVGGQIVAQMARQGYKPPYIVGMHALADEIYETTAGSLANGITYASSPIIPPNDKHAAQCNATLPKGMQPTFHSLLGCAQAQLLVAALKAAGPNLTRDGLLRAISKWQAKAATPVMPPLTADATHLMVKGLYIVNWQKNGTPKAVARVSIPAAYR